MASFTNMGNQQITQYQWLDALRSWKEGSGQLSISACIELTEKFFSSYHSPQDFSDIGHIWEGLKQTNCLTEEQVLRIKTIIEDSKAMAATLQLSLKAMQPENDQDITSIASEFMRLASHITQPTLNDEN